MRRIKSVFLVCVLIVLPMIGFASDEHDMGTFHAVRLQVDYGEGKDDSAARWDLDGWVGSDDSKLWIKSEGDNVAGSMERVENWVLYSRNIATFWDAQVGLRHDSQPQSTSYAVIGFNGLAPYFFETEVHLFVSEVGNVSARVREENDFLFTQKFIMKPYAELNWYAQRVSEQQKGVGFSSGELGVQFRYEITRKLAPYFDLRYEKKLGDTAGFARSNNERTEDVSASFGVQLWF